MPKGVYERKKRVAQVMLANPVIDFSAVDRLNRLLELFTAENRHTFLKPGQGQLGRMSKDFYLIPAERVEEIVKE